MRELASRTRQLEQEAGNFRDFLKDTTSINAMDVTVRWRCCVCDTIEKLRAELGATTKQPRNKIGRWIAKK